MKFAQELHEKHVSTASPHCCGWLVNSPHRHKSTSVCVCVILTRSISFPHYDDHGILYLYVLKPQYKILRKQTVNSL